MLPISCTVWARNCKNKFLASLPALARTMFNAWINALEIQIKQSVDAKTFLAVCLVFIEAQSQSDVYLMNAIVYRLERRSRPRLSGLYDHTQRVCCNLALRGSQRAKEKGLCSKKVLELQLCTLISQQVIMVLRCLNWHLMKKIWVAQQLEEITTGHFWIALESSQLCAG